MGFYSLQCTRVARRRPVDTLVAVQLRIRRVLMEAWQWAAEMIVRDVERMQWKLRDTLGNDCRCFRRRIARQR